MEPPRPSPGDSSLPGCVVLVGAGPGAADLLTMRGAHWLRQADVVLYDYLANPALLAGASPRAELVCLGRHGRERVWSQDQINQRIVEEAQAGKCVVRLKGGDPIIFGCLAQELQAIISARIPFEIVPGVTAASAAAAGTGLAITHRDLASAVALVTGREDRDKADASLDYAALARFPGTLVFYMGTTTVETWSTGLLAAGKAATTPVAIVRRASLSDQTMWETTLGDVASLVRRETPLRPPVVFIVGAVADPAHRLTGQRLRQGDGQTVLVTRPLAQAGALVEQLRVGGFQAISWPVIEVREPDDWAPVDALLARPCEFEWAAFTSSNGVDGFMERLLASGRDSRWLGACRIAAVGPGTAQRLRNGGSAPICCQKRSRHGTWRQRSSRRLSQETVYCSPAVQSRPELSHRLEEADRVVSAVAVYQTSPVTHAEPHLVASMEAGHWNWTTVTSPRVAETLHQIFGPHLARTRLVSIQPADVPQLA
ncbi:MAG: uroporphyrinogen-III C-methyltransferase [Pirellulaceae bacterium]